MPSNAKDKRKYYGEEGERWWRDYLPASLLVYVEVAVA